MFPSELCPAFVSSFAFLSSIMLPMEVGGLTPQAAADLMKSHNKFRRAFSWRLSEGNNRKAEIAGAVRLSTGDYPDILEDYLYISRKRQRNATAIAQLQMHMLYDLAAQEQSIRHYKAKLDEASKDPRAEQLVRSELFKHRMISNAIRIIGDGIAWRSFAYDRLIPRILSAHPVKHVVTSEGLAAEMNEWSDIFFHPSKIAIMNSVTNCLAIGDVTSIETDGSIELVEVKADKTKSSRKIRQKAKLRDAAGILGSGVGLVDGKEMRVASAPITPRNSLTKLEAMLKASTITGWSAELVEPHCYVECMDFRKAGDESTVSKMEEARREATKAWRDDDEVLTMGSMDVITFSPNVAPFSIFPFADRTCVELAIGAQAFYVTMNLSVLFQTFKSHGWEVESSSRDTLRKTDGEAAAIIRKDRFHARIPPGDFSRLQFELLSPSTLLEEYEYIRSLGPSVEGYSVWLLEGESEQWR